MTNKDAAIVLRNLADFPRVGRCNGKSMTTLIIIEALMKAIALLEETPDKLEIERIYNGSKS